MPKNCIAFGSKTPWLGNLINAAPTSPPWRWIAVAVVLTGLIWLVTVVLITRKPSTQGINVAVGKAKFRDHCGACHIVEKGISTHHGPNLYDFGKLAGQRKPNMSAAEYVLESILDPEAYVAPENRHGMPRQLASNLSVDELRNIVAFVVSCGGTPDYAEILALEIPNVVRTTEVRTVRRDEMELAEKILRERAGCLQCHSRYRNAEHRVYAPGLFAVGLSDEVMLRESIVDPNKVVSPYHRWVSVILTDGTVESGKIVAQSDDRLLLVKRGEANDLVQVEIAREEIDEEDGELLIQTSLTSPMPTGLDQLLSERELDVLIQMIRQLN